MRTEQYKDAANLDARIALHARFSTNGYGWHRWVFDQVDAPTDAHVLEIGCGPGTLWRENADRIPADWRVTLSDFSPGILADARRNLSGIADDLEFVVAGAQALPFPDGAFDIVIANHMLYHVPDIDAALFEVRRVLRPAGRLYAATNGRDHLRELFEMERTVTGTEALPPHHRFGLENGGAMLERHFADVALHCYEDSLCVTEAEPLIAYMRSDIATAGVSDDAFARLRAQVDERLGRSGAITITKSSGLFAAMTASPHPGDRKTCHGS